MGLLVLIGLGLGGFYALRASAPDLTEDVPAARQRRRAQPPRSRLPPPTVVEEAPKMVEGPVVESELDAIHGALSRIGEGHTVRCDVPALTPQVSPFTRAEHGLPPVATWRHGVLQARVQQLEGEAEVWDDHRFRGMLRWPADTGAGSCLFDPVRWIPIEGVLLDADGEPMADAPVLGCRADLWTRTADDGTFTVEAAEGRVCYAAYHHLTDEGESKTATGVCADESQGLDEGCFQRVQLSGKTWSFEQNVAEARNVVDMVLAQLERERASREQVLEEACRTCSAQERALVEQVYGPTIDRVDYKMQILREAQEGDDETVLEIVMGILTREW